MIAFVPKTTFLDLMGHLRNKYLVQQLALNVHPVMHRFLSMNLKPSLLKVNRINFSVV